MRPRFFAAFLGADAMWDYMPVGPFATEAELVRWIAEAETSEDPLFFAFTPKGGSARRASEASSGSRPRRGSIEVGFLAFSPGLQRSVAATEAMYLMMKWAFEAGYRRYEWKCDTLNAPSRRAAARLGLSYEGRVPAGDGREGAQPRHRLVRGDRHGVAHVGPRPFGHGWTPGISTRQGVRGRPCEI